MAKLKKPLIILGIGIMISFIVYFKLNNSMAYTLNEFSEESAYTVAQTARSKPEPQPELLVQEKTDKSKTDYYVYKDKEIIGAFVTYEEALDFAQNQENVSIKKKGMANTLWNNLPPYSVYLDYDKHTNFATYAEACLFAKEQKRAFIYYRANHSLLWDSVTDYSVPSSVQGVPLIYQLPELPRGCEVTSLTMLIQFLGLNVDKMELAEKIAKVPFKTVIDNTVYYGNPNEGFVGDMRSMKANGLGVYHKPIYDLLQSYFPDSAIDLTGCKFEDLYSFIFKGTPVWIIINSQYRKLPDSEFETYWVTKDGSVNITYREHSVLITGYDEQYVYFNDPLGATDRAPLKEFIEAWEQMGSQAVSIAK